MPSRTAFCSFCRKSYQDVGPLVEGPGDVYICGECVELCQSIIVQEKRRRHGWPAPLSSSPPEEIQARLGQWITGQEEVLTALAGAAYRHYDRWRRVDQGRDTTPVGNTLILLVGPSRSSKVLLAHVLASALDVPWAHGEAAALATKNTPGQEGESLFLRLLEACDFQIEVARCSIVYLDGVDERAGQRAFLKLLQKGVSSALPDDLSFDVSGILFLCGGTFANLDEVMTHRGRHPEQPVNSEDLLACGMLPELVSRLQGIVRLLPLDEETLVRIVSCVDLKGVV
jgi:ATP-dependent Clp protease ATP-binding subunit ClpX